MDVFGELLCCRGVSEYGLKDLCIDIGLHCLLTSVTSNLRWLADSDGARRDMVDLRSTGRTRTARCQRRHAVPRAVAPNRLLPVDLRALDRSDRDGRACG